MHFISSVFFILALYTSFLATLFFTTSFTLLKISGTGTYLSTPNSSTLLFKLLKPRGTFLSISSLSTPDVKSAKSVF